LYEDLFYTALQRFRDEEGLGPRKKKFRFKNQLLSLDSTTIFVVPEVVSLGQVSQGQGRRQGLTFLLEPRGLLAGYVLITEAKCSDLKMVDAFSLNPAPSCHGSRL